MYEENFKELGFAIANQAVRDFFNPDFKAQKKSILKDLRSEWIAMLTDGMGEHIAEKLEAHPQEIKKRLKKADARLGGN